MSGEHWAWSLDQTFRPGTGQFGYTQRCDCGYRTKWYQHPGSAERAVDAHIATKTGENR